MKEDQKNEIESIIIGFVIAIVILFVIEMLSSCAVYPEPEQVEWKPRHTGTYVECDTVVEGVSMYYFKRDSI